MLLSIGMMVKNEEKHLEECLESLTPILEEIDSELIIVDTGSTDRTLEIARKFTDQVFKREWTNDFAEMRNIVLSYTSGEWFFFVDGDEIVTDSNGLIEFFTLKQYQKYNSGAILMRNLLSTNNENAFGIFRALRLFKNDDDFHFKGIVHEQPAAKLPVAEIKGEIIHFGYLNDDTKLMEYKFQRNVELLEIALEQNPKDIYTLFQLSQSYAMYKDYKKALEYIVIAYEYAKKRNLSDYIYVLNHLVNIYNNNKLYVESESICRYGLRLNKNNIDLLYYQGYAQIELGKLEKAINSFEQYLRLIGDFEQGKLKFNLTMDFKTLGSKENVYSALCGLYNKLGQLNRALEYGEEIKTESIFKNVAPHLIDVYLKQGNIHYVKKLYVKWSHNENISAMIEKIIESKLSTMDQEEKKELSRLFADEQTAYGYLHMVRSDYYGQSEGLPTQSWEKIKKIDIHKREHYYGDIVFAFIRYNQPIVELLSDVRNDKITSLFMYLFNNHKDFSNVFIKLVNDRNLWITDDNNRDQVYRIKTAALYAFLQQNDMKNYQYYFHMYIEVGIQYIEACYNPDILDLSTVSWTKNGTDGFLAIMRLAKMFERENVEYLRYLREALGQDETMKQGIEVLLKEVQEELTDPVQNELKELKKSIQDAIKDAINAGEIDTAIALINEYEDAVGLDAPLCSAKGIIFMINEQLEDAENIFLAGLDFEPNNADLLYNLGYINDIQNDFGKAREYYNKSLKNARNTNVIDDASEALNLLRAKEVKLNPDSSLQDIDSLSAKLKSKYGL